MTTFPWKTMSALAALVLSALACASPFGEKTVGFVTVGPDPAVTVSPDDMKEASEVIGRRLNAAGLYHGMDVSDTQIKIYLADLDDQQAVTALATTPGALEFFESDVALEPGTVVSDLGEPVLTDSEFASAKAVESSMTGSWEIQFTLTTNGATIFAEVTAANVGRYLVIAQDGIVLSSPAVMSAIVGGEGVIAGQFDEAAAKLLAAELSGGRLPVALEVLSVSQSKP